MFESTSHEISLFFEFMDVFDLQLTVLQFNLNRVLQFYTVLQLTDFSGGLKSTGKRITYPASSFLFCFFAWSGILFLLPSFGFAFYTERLQCTNVFTVLCLLPCLPNLVESSCFSEQGKRSCLQWIKQQLKCSSIFLFSYRK